MNRIWWAFLKTKLGNTFHKNNLGGDYYYLGHIIIYWAELFLEATYDCPYYLMGPPINASINCPLIKKVEPSNDAHYCF